MGDISMNSGANINVESNILSLLNGCGNNSRILNIYIQQSAWCSIRCLNNDPQLQMRSPNICNNMNSNGICQEFKDVKEFTEFKRNQMFNTIQSE